MKKILLFFCLFTISFISSNAQLIDSMINVYAEQVPDQKVHVHFDKDIYRAGETIWFKAYLLSGFSLAINSKNFYAELINDKGNIIQRKTYPIIESAAAGNFDLPDSLPAGNFIFRGYTTWMLNFDTSFIFQKGIIVTDMSGIGEKQKEATPRTTSIQFLPEGGNLVTTLKSVVAFKANDNYGKPVFTKGNIVNSKGAVVTSFAATHDGMGTFSLTPDANEIYNAVWTDATGKQQTTALPEAKASGYVLRMSSTGKKRNYELSRTENVPEDWKKVYIVALLGQQRVYRAKANFETLTKTSEAIPVEGFPSGIMQVTVFSSTWEPITERIVMINNDNYHFAAGVNTPILNTDFRAKNAVEVQVDDTLLTNLSIAVTDAATSKQSYGDNIISRMLLTGDIKGFVYNPGYYFQNNSDSMAAKLDLIMLTHGWRRYNWSMLVKGKKPLLKFPTDSYLGIDAKVFGVTTASPLRSDEKLILIIEGKDSSKQFLEMPKTGIDKFSLPGIIFFDTTTVYYQFTKDKKAEKDMTLAFSNNLYNGTRKATFANLYEDLQIDKSIVERTKFLADKINQYGSKFNISGNVLQNVTVKTRGKTRMQELDEKYASGLFKTDNGYVFDLTSDNSVNSMDIFSYLRGRVAGLLISGNGANTTLTWRGSQTSVFLNEMPADVQSISTVSVRDIAYIKVLRPPFFGAMGGGAGGAVAIYTKRGNDVKVEPGAGLNKSIVTGYSSLKEFYSPDYKDLSASASVAADFRSTLYWNSSILTDKSKQKVRVEFYNNDITKSFRIVLEGVNEIGQLVRIEKVVQGGKQ